MMKNIVFTILFLLNSVSYARDLKNSEMIRVAVVDTGLSTIHEAPLCDKGHKDFTDPNSKDGEVPNDRHGHGSHISDIIDQYVKNEIRNGYFSARKNISKKNSMIKYCQIILKYYNPIGTGAENLKASTEALKKAIELDVDVINYSGGGSSYDKDEKEIILKALEAGITVVAAAGNDAMDLDQSTYYPASYDKRIIVVGNMINRKTRSISSNFGKDVDVWEVGTGVIGKVNGKPLYMSGTSQATAIRTGKIIRMMLHVIKK